MLHREMHTNPTDYKVFLLRIAQGFCSQSKKPSFAPLRVRNRSFSRAKCRSCSDSNPYRDSRTSKFCDRCGDACCTNHAKHICQSCFERFSCPYSIFMFLHLLFFLQRCWNVFGGFFCLSL